jgi:MFS family permease
MMRSLAALPYRALHALLRVDQPVPSRTDQELAAEVERHYRWNFAANLMDGASFWFGASFISSSTILPLFVSKLTTNPLPLGLLAVIAQSGWFLPQLFTANAVERLARRKPVIVNLGLFTERLPLWGLIVAAMLATRSPLLAMTVFFVSYAGHAVGAGIVAPAWQELIARCFPVNPWEVPGATSAAVFWA